MILSEVFHGSLFFNLCASAAVAEFCEWILVGTDVYTFFESIGSSLIHVNSFLMLMVLPLLI